METGFFQAILEGYQVEGHFGGRLEFPFGSVWVRRPTKSDDLLVLALTSYGPMGGIEEGTTVQIPRAMWPKALRAF
jgi:hypothetical protein